MTGWHIIGAIALFLAIVAMAISLMARSGRRHRRESAWKIVEWMAQNAHLQPHGEFLIADIMEGVDLSYAVVFYVLQELEESGKVLSHWGFGAPGERRRFYRLSSTAETKIGDDDEA